MIKNIQNVLKHNFEWMRNDLIFLVFLILITRSALNFIDINGLFEFILLVILFIKTIMFGNEFSLLPGFKNGKDQFSWKFLQGLPLNKEELIFSLSISALMSGIPLLLWFACFWQHIDTNILHSNFLIAKWLVNITLFIFLAGIWTIVSLIEYPRKEYQRKNAKNQLIRLFRNILITITTIIYLAIGMIQINERFDIDLFHTTLKIINTITAIATSWWSSPLLLAVIILSYFHTLRVWANEKNSYTPNVWNPKKEYFQISILCCLLFIGYTSQDMKTPSRYKGVLTKAVYKKDYKAIEKELKINPNINIANEYGMTPMLVAINENNLEMVKFLEKKGATFEGNITKKKDKLYGFNAVLFSIRSEDNKMLEYVTSKKSNFNVFNRETGYYPIHLAAYSCESQMLDFLIQKGSDVNSLNSEKETPLIVAAKVGCLSAAITLKEAGANFNLVDKDGKKALERMKITNDNKEFQYFVEKNSRVPASKNK